MVVPSAPVRHQRNSGICASAPLPLRSLTLGAEGTAQSRRSRSVPAGSFGWRPAVGRAARGARGRRGGAVLPPAVLPAACRGVREPDRKVRPCPSSAEACPAAEFAERGLRGCREPRRAAWRGRRRGSRRWARRGEPPGPAASHSPGSRGAAEPGGGTSLTQFPSEVKTRTLLLQRVKS